MAEQSPTDIATELLNNNELIRFVLNDIHPNVPKPFAEIEKSEFLDAFEALVSFPFELSKALYPALVEQGKGHILFITSARQLQPEPICRCHHYSFCSNGHGHAAGARSGSTWGSSKCFTTELFVQ